MVSESLAMVVTEARPEFDEEQYAVVSAAILADGATDKLSTQTATDIKFVVQTTDISSGKLTYTMSGTDKDQSTATSITADASTNNNYTIAAVTADGDGYVTVTINGRDGLIETKEVSVAAGWNDNSKTVANVSGGTALDDASKTVAITKPASVVGFTESSKNVEVEITLGSAADNALEFTLNTNDKIVVKKGATTGSGIFTFADGVQLSIASVKQLSAPTIVSVELKDTNGDPITSYAAGDKIVITFSENMDTSKTTAGNLASITGTGTISSVSWTSDTELTITVGAALVADDIIKIGGQTADELESAATAMDVVSKSYTVGNAGTPLVEVVAP